MKPTWILIANAAHARLLEQDERGRLAVLHAFEHPASRLRSSELGDDKAGRELSGRGFGGAAFEPRLDPQRKEHLHFARDLAAHLEHAADEGRYEALQVFASSPFLGELQQELGEGTRRLLASVHDVDLTHVGLAELPARLQQHQERA